MPKPKAVAQAVTAKKRSMPSILRTANSRGQRTPSKNAPPVDVIESKAVEKISDLTTPIETKRGPPIHEIHSAYQSAASSLTMSSTFRTMSVDEDYNMEHPKYSNLVYPESPIGRKEKRSIERSNSGSLKPPPVALKRTESSDSMSQQYLVKKRSLVVGIPVEQETSPDHHKQVSPGTDIAIGEKTPKQQQPTSPTTQETIAGTNKSSKTSRKIGFKAVKALISRVQSGGGSPRKRTSPNKSSRKKGGNAQREEASIRNTETTASKTPVKRQSSERPVIQTKLLHRDIPPLEPPAMTETRSSSDPSPKRTSYAEEPPDLTETKSSEDPSVEMRTWGKGTSLEPPEWERMEMPRAGSPELRREDVSPKLAKNSRRRGLEPDALVAFGDRHPVDAPEKTAPLKRPLRIVGIPVDMDDVSEMDDGTRGQPQQGKTTRNSGPPHQPSDSKTESGIPISARVARARRASKPINPFDSSSGTSSSIDQQPEVDVLKTNPFESSDDDDPFDRILMGSMSDDEGIPAPNARPRDKTNTDRLSSQEQIKGLSESSPLREQNRQNTTGTTSGQKTQKHFPVQELNVQDDAYVSDLEQSHKGFRVEHVELDRYGADISAMDTSGDAQDTIETKGSSRNGGPNENVALADSISEGSGYPSNRSVPEENPVNETRYVIGELVEDTGITFEGQPQSATFPEKTPRVSNEARKNHDHDQTRRDPSDRVRYDQCDDDSREGEAARDDILDRFFTFIHETNHLSPKSKQKIHQSLENLPSEAKLIVAAGLEKAKHASESQDGIQSFYQDEDIEIAFQNLDWSATAALNHFMDDHKRFPLSKIRKIGGSVASGVDTGTVDASEASELLSELQEYSSVIKGAARRSMKKSISAGMRAPTWTKQLIDLTGVDSFRDLETEEAIWLFDLNSSVETPRSDLESIMAFAEKRLGYSLDRDALLTAAKINHPPISTVGALTPHTTVTDSPFAVLREESSVSKPQFKFDVSIDEQQVEQKNATMGNLVYDTCKEAEAILCGHAPIETSVSDDSNQDGDKYKVKNDEDKYSQELDEKALDEKALEDQSPGANDTGNSAAKYPDHDSEVSSSDGLSVILSKIKRDIKDAEDSLPTPREASKKSTPLPEPQKESNRRDFLDILVEATGSLFCGAVDISNHGFYQGTQSNHHRKKVSESTRRMRTTAPSSRRTRTNAPFISQPDDDPDDPFSGLELESPSASESTAYASPNTKKVETPTGDNECKSETKSTTNCSPDTSDPLVSSSPIQTNTDAFENSGSLLNKGPFSPINEQPSAEEETLSSDDGDNLPSTKVQTANHQVADQADPVTFTSSEAYDRPDRNEMTGIGIKNSVDQDKVPTSDPTKDSGLISSRREPPMPEVLEHEDFVSHRLQHAPGGKDIIEEVPNIEPQNESNDDHASGSIIRDHTAAHTGPHGRPTSEIKSEPIEIEATLTPKSHAASLQPRKDAEIILGENGQPILEKEMREQASEYQESQSEGLVAGIDMVSGAVTKDGVKDECYNALQPVQIAGEEKEWEKPESAPPVPELTRVDTSTPSRVSLIVSKFENQSSVETNNRTSDQPDLFGTPETNSTRFSRISSIRSKFERRGVSKKMPADSPSLDEVNVGRTNELLFGKELVPEEEEKKEDFHETIDLTDVEGDGDALLLGQHGDFDLTSNGSESKELIGAVLSGEGTRPESPIFVGEDVNDTIEKPNENPPIVHMLQSDHIDLIELITLTGEKLESGLNVDDGRSSDIAFSLSPSTAASSRVFQSFHSQHQLLDVLPKLAPSSSSEGPDKASQELSISSTNVEGTKHCDTDPNTIPGEISVNKKSTPRSLMESNPLSTIVQGKEEAFCMSCSDDDANSSGEESAGLLLALTRSETDMEVAETAAQQEQGTDNRDQRSSSPESRLSLIVTSPKSMEQDPAVRKVASPLFTSIQKRLVKQSGFQDGTEDKALNAEELFAMLDEKDKSIVDLTTYDQSAESGIESTSSDADSKSPKANPFLATLMDRLRTSPSAKRFASKSCSSASSVKSSGSSFDSISNKPLISEKGSSDIDDLFQRYDEIVKNMVVLDEDRLARVQAKQMASIVMAADSAVDHTAHSPKALSEIARRLRRTASERKREDRVMVNRGEAYKDAGDTLANGKGSASVASDSTHPSSHARQLRRDLQAALDKSADIRYSQQQLGDELSNFQAKLNMRRSVSAGRSRSLPSSPAKSYYHRNCCNSSSDGTSLAGDLSTVDRSETQIPRTILTQKTNMTSEDEDDVQSRQLESIRSGLRSSVGRSPRAKARRQRFRRSHG